MNNSSHVRFESITYPPRKLEELLPKLHWGSIIEHNGRRLLVTIVGQNHIKAKANPEDRQEHATVLMRGCLIKLVVPA